MRYTCTDEEIIEYADYMVRTQCSMTHLSRHFYTSYSAMYRYITQRLYMIDKERYDKCKEVLWSHYSAKNKKGLTK